MVDDQMEREPARDLVVNRREEPVELQRPRAAMKLPEHGARFAVERDAQLGGAP